MSGIQRTTSQLAYDQISTDGLLNEQCWLVYQTLFRHGPLTITECFKIIESRGVRWNYNTRTRFVELRERGVVKELGVTRCSITGRKVILWDVTANLPAPPPPPPVCPLCERVTRKKQPVVRRTLAQIGICQRVAFWACVDEFPTWAEEEVVQHVKECAACLAVLEAGA